MLGLEAALTFGRRSQLRGHADGGAVFLLPAEFQVRQAHVTPLGKQPSSSGRWARHRASSSPRSVPSSSVSPACGSVVVEVFRSTGAAGVSGGGRGRGRESSAGAPGASSATVSGLRGMGPWCPSTEAAFQATALPPEGGGVGGGEHLTTRFSRPTGAPSSMGRGQGGGCAPPAAERER